MTRWDRRHDLYIAEDTMYVIFKIIRYMSALQEAKIWKFQVYRARDG